jgi:hypothetical protein
VSGKSRPSKISNNTKRRIAVALGSPKLQTFGVSIKNFTADTVFVAYQGLPGNQPHCYQNFVAIWEATVIPWTVKPLTQMTIPEDRESGDVVIDRLTITKSSYIVGYGVGSEITTICASAQLHAGGLRAAPTFVQIGLNHVGTDSISINYQTLPGYLPHSYKNWIGLWQGYASPYDAPEPLAKACIPTDSSEGNLGINDVPMGINTTYTLIYFVGPERTEAAAILTFNTSDYDGAEAH